MMRARRPMDAMSMQRATQVLQREGYVINQTRIFELCRFYGWISGVEATESGRANGYVTSSTGSVIRQRGDSVYGFTYIRTFLTRRGLDYLRQHLAWRAPVETVLNQPDLRIGA